MKIYFIFFIIITSKKYVTKKIIGNKYYNDYKMIIKYISKYIYDYLNKLHVEFFDNNKK